MENTLQAKKPVIFRGWVVVIAASILAAFSGGTTNFSYFVVGNLSREGVISSTTPGFITSIVSLCSVLFATSVGALIKKKGHRFVMLIGFIMPILAYTALILLPTSDVLCIAAAFSFGFCLCCNSKMASPSLVHTWFQHNRAIPMTLVIATPSAITIFTGFQAKFMDAFGYTGGWGFILIMCVLALPIIAIFIRDDIRGVGEVRDGKWWREKRGLPMDDGDVAKSAENGDAKDSEKGALRKNGRFWAFSICCLLRMGVFAGSSAYITIIILSKGFSRTEAAMALASLTLSSTVGRLTTPVVTKLFRFSNVFANVIAHLCMTAGCVLLVFGSNLTEFSIAIILMGYAYGLGFVSQTLALGDLFPQVAFTSALGLFTTVVNCSFIFPTLVGFIGKALGENYSPVYLVMGIINILAAVIVFFCRPKSVKIPSASAQ